MGKGEPGEGPGGEEAKGVFGDQELCFEREDSGPAGWNPEDSGKAGFGSRRSVPELGVKPPNMPARKAAPSEII